VSNGRSDAAIGEAGKTGEATRVDLPKAVKAAVGHSIWAILVVVVTVAVVLGLMVEGWFQGRLPPPGRGYCGDSRRFGLPCVARTEQTHQ
jgi:hypothetical protein